MIWEVEQRGEQWDFRPTIVGRLLSAVSWAFISLPFAALFAVLFFGIDWVGRIAVGVDVPGGFVLTVAVFSGFVAFVAFVARMLRFRRWIVDRTEQTIALSHRRAFADARVVEVPLSELRRVRLERGQLGSKSRLVLEFGDESEETFAETRLFGDHLNGVIEGLRSALEGSGVDVDAGGEE